MAPSAPRLAVLLILLAPLALQAQTPEEKEAQRSAAEAEERQKAAEEAARAAEEAQRLKALGEEPEVSLEQVAAEPNNIELNYRYARSQASKGNENAPPNRAPEKTMPLARPRSPTGSQL